VEIDILTLFPAMGESLLGESMLRIAREKGLADIRLRNLREWAPGKHRVTDEPPYGGGAGMVFSIYFAYRARIGPVSTPRSPA
jgi:tRNA (guanine37-N1)-methyltransferase